MYKILGIIGAIVILMCSPTTVLASETQVPDGYKVVTGNEGGSLSDAFRGVKEQNNANIDKEIMEKADKKISTFAGTLTSAIIYIIFSMLAFSTAIDLLYFAFPAVRPYLYDAPQQPMRIGGNTGYGGYNRNYGMPRQNYGGYNRNNYGGYNRRRY